MNVNKIRHILKALFALAMFGSAIGKLSQQEALVSSIQNLNYPIYLLTILGAAYLVGVISIYQSIYTPLQQWAYGGFLAALTGAAASHFLVGDPFVKAVPAVVLLVVLIVLLALEQAQNNT